jgi:hypothetical protein
LANGADPTPISVEISEHVTRTTYGDDGAPNGVVLWTIRGGGHTWPGTRLGPLVRLILGHTTTEVDATALINASRSDAGQTIDNFLIFIPLGLLLGVNFKRVGRGQKLICVVALSVTVEALQFAFAIGATDITDVITNTAGGLFGLLLYDATNRRVDGRKLDTFICVAGSILVALVVWVLLSHRVRFHTHG